MEKKICTMRFLAHWISTDVGSDELEFYCVGSECALWRTQIVDGNGNILGGTCGLGGNVRDIALDIDPFEDPAKD